MQDSQNSPELAYSGQIAVPLLPPSTAAVNYVVLAKLSLEQFAALYPLGGWRVPPVL